jgi:predicted transcriptional regulator
VEITEQVKEIWQDMTFKKKEEDDREFEPSFMILSRISKILLESGSVGKLDMSIKGKMNYPRLNKHLNWLAKKHLIEAVFEDSKMKMKLTQKGKEFATTIYKTDSYA